MGRQLMRSERESEKLEDEGSIPSRPTRGTKTVATRTSYKSQECPERNFWAPCPSGGIGRRSGLVQQPERSEVITHTKHQKSAGREVVRVQVPSWAPTFSERQLAISGISSVGWSAVLITQRSLVRFQDARPIQSRSSAARMSPCHGEGVGSIPIGTAMWYLSSVGQNASLSRWRSRVRTPQVSPLEGVGSNPASWETGISLKGKNS